MSHRGRFVPVVGPTGSGKDTLINHAKAAFPDIVLSISCTTRAPREGEVDGKDYYFLTREEFEERIRTGALLEWAEFGGNYYGTPGEIVEKEIADGKLVMGDIEVQGVRQIRERMQPEDFGTIYVDAGSWDVLAARALARAPMGAEELQKRKERYEDESTFKEEATYVVENPDGKLDEAKEQMLEIVRGIRADIGLV